MSRKWENPAISSIPLLTQKSWAGGGRRGETTIMEDFNHRQSKRHTGD